MSVSTDGQLAYGYIFEEGYEFPWITEGGGSGGEGDFQEWWMLEKGFKPSVMPFDESGKYKQGVDYDHPDTTQYFKERQEFMRGNPDPFEIVNYQSCDCPAYMLAVKGTVVSARRGYPTQISSLEMTFNQSDVDALDSFIDKYKLEAGKEGELGWYLSSLWC